MAWNARWGLNLAAVAVVLPLAGTYAFFQLFKPERVPPAPIQVQVTPARVARGKYLFNLADCDGCHSQRDFSRFAGPVVEGGRGKGAVIPGELGLPGRVVAPNITPDGETGLGNWTDGEKIRAIRDGVSRDGHPLFPFMPYESYRHMSDEDVFSLVAYLKTLQPVRNPLPKTSIRFPVSMLIRSAPQPAGSVPPPDRANPVRYGEYLTTLASCTECHTQADQGKLNAAKLLAGGREFRYAGTAVVSANITPDAETGIGSWTEQYFVERVLSYRKHALHGSPAVGAESFTLMPWLNYAQLEPDDLRAIYAYLRAQKPIRNFVDTHPEPRRVSQR